MSDPVNVINPVKTQSICISAQSLHKLKLEELDDLDESVEDLQKVSKESRGRKLDGAKGKLAVTTGSSRCLRRRSGRGDGEGLEVKSDKGSELNCQRSRTVGLDRKSQSPKSKRGRSRSTSLSPVKKQRRLKGTRKKYVRKAPRKGVRQSRRLHSTSPMSDTVKAADSGKLTRSEKSSIKRQSPCESNDNICSNCLNPQYSQPNLTTNSKRPSLVKQMLEDCCNCCGDLFSTTDVTIPPSLKIKSQSRSKSVTRTMSTCKRTMSPTSSRSASIPDYKHPILKATSKLMKKDTKLLRNSTPKSIRVKSERPETIKPIQTKQQRRKQPNKMTVRNPFINFLRQFRKNRGDWHPCKVAVEGSRKWCSLGEKERTRFAGPFLTRSNVGGHVGRPKKIIHLKRPVRKINVVREHKRIKKWLKKRGVSQKFRRSKRRSM